MTSGTSKHVGGGKEPRWRLVCYWGGRRNIVGKQKVTAGDCKREKDEEERQETDREVMNEEERSSD